MGSRRAAEAKRSALPIYAMNQNLEGEKSEAASKPYECDACGADVSFDDNVCPNCGADISEVDDSVADNSTRTGNGKRTHGPTSTNSSVIGGGTGSL